MTECRRKDFISLLLPFCVSASVLLVLLCGLSRTARADPGTGTTTMVPEKSRPGFLDFQPGVPVREQAHNLVPNPGFEQGIGCTHHWCTSADCTFQTYEPGHDSATSAMILAESVRENRCMLFTPIDEIPVETGRFYDYSAWIKAALSTGHAYLRITFWSRQGDPPVWNYEGEAQTNSVTDTQGSWVQATGSVQVPANAEYARVEATLPASSVGSVWFDDVFLGLATCLECSKRAHPDPVSPGQALTYTIVCSNTGREKATNVDIVEIYDEYVDFERAQPPPVGSDNIWQISELFPGASEVITVIVSVRDDPEQRAWLFNTVRIGSDEVVQPASTTISTSLAVPTETCAIALEPLRQAVSGAPGEAMEYSLCLWNVGFCDGAVDLELVSSQNGVIDITPPPPYSLSPGSSMSLTISLTIPQDMTCGDVDVAHITATLACGPPCSQTAASTATITTTIGCPVFLPIVMRDFEGCFPGPWEVEPNDFCDQANGPLCSATTYYGYHDDGWDFFSIYLCSAGQITVDLTVAGCEGVQLQLLDRECELVAYVWQPPYHVEYTGTAGWYYIAIYTESGSACETPYTLRAMFP